MWAMRRARSGAWVMSGWALSRGAVCASGSPQARNMLNGTCNQHMSPVRESTRPWGCAAQNTAISPSRIVSGCPPKR